MTPEEAMGLGARLGFPLFDATDPRRDAAIDRAVALLKREIGRP